MARTYHIKIIVQIVEQDAGILQVESDFALPEDLLHRVSFGHHIDRLLEQTIAEQQYDHAMRPMPKETG